MGHDDKETTQRKKVQLWWLIHRDNRKAGEEDFPRADILAGSPLELHLPLSRGEDDAIGEDFPRADIMADFSVEKYRYSGISRFYRNIVPRRDMPEEFVLVEGSSISFMVSRDFYDKFLGLALCVVFNVEEGENEIFFDIMPHVNGQRRNGLSGSLGLFDSDHMWIQYLKPNILWGVLEGAVDFLEFDKDYLQFSLTLRLSGGTMEKLGYVLRCKRMDDKLKVLVEDNQLVDPASIYEMEWRDFNLKFLYLWKFLPRRMEEVEASDIRDTSEIKGEEASGVVLA
ncbi:hypothetical protein BT93_C0252 [Corymbia citriodora subsp. variegata]|nr:hypothetical protein BT93_C0252 [Corymbia citriodora subsp. variegata]